VFRVADKIVDEGQKVLLNLKKNPDVDAHEKKTLDDLKKRKKLNIVSNKSYKVSKGKNYAPIKVKLQTALTADMLRNGTWQTEKFKKQNLEALGRDAAGGHLHPLLKVRTQFR